MDAVLGIASLFSEEQQLLSLLDTGTTELFDNLLEDIATAGLIGTWIVFEQVTKQLRMVNYSHSLEEISMNFRDSAFGLSDREKADLDLFYYFRNACVHYNGAYFAASSVDHTYRGVRYVSAGHHGQKIALSPPLVHNICRDVEAMTLKSWSNFKRYGTPRPPRQ